MKTSLLCWKNLQKDMSEKWAISPLFSTLLVAAILFIICGDGIIYKVSIQNVSRNERLPPNLSITCITQRQTQPVQLLQQSIDDDDYRETPDSLAVPSHLSAEERIAWFKKNLPKFQILQPNNLQAPQFHDRLVEFLSHECELRFFMTWISPARSFGGREFLALESVFKAHPHACLTILSRTMASEKGHRILKPLLDYGFKILALTPDLPFLFNSTPAEAWFNEMKRGKKDPGQIPLAQNLSNLMRLAVLYKYGGVYLDTDFIVLKSFLGLENVIGAQTIDPVSKNWTNLNNAALIFEKKHPLLLKFMENFASNFNGNKWGHNGPFLVSRVVAKIEARGRERGDYNFTILAPAAFYPVDWIKIAQLFKRPENQAAENWTNAMVAEINYESYGIHLWNKHSKSYVMQKGSVVERLVSDHCIICKPTN